MKLNDVILLTKYEAIDPGELIAHHFKFSHLNGYLKYLKDIKNLNLGEKKDKITREIYKEALKDYVSVRINWINNYLRFINFGYFKDDDGSLPKYYTPEKKYEIPSRKYLISLSDEELKNFLYTLPTKINDG